MKYFRSSLHRKLAAVALMFAVITLPPLPAEASHDHRAAPSAPAQHTAAPRQGTSHPVAAIYHPLRLERIRGEGPSLLSWPIQTAWCSVDRATLSPIHRRLLSEPAGYQPRPSSRAG